MKHSLLVMRQKVSSSEALALHEASGVDESKGRVGAYSNLASSASDDVALKPAEDERPFLGAWKTNAGLEW